MTVDDDLARFNAFMASEAEQEKQGRRVKKAEQAKEKAAADVRRLDADDRATAEQKADAKQAYLDATDAWRRELAGEGAEDPTPAEDAAPGDESTDSAEDAAPGAESSDDSSPAEPVAEAETIEAPTEEPAPSDDAPAEGVETD